MWLWVSLSFADDNLAWGGEQLTDDEEEVTPPDPDPDPDPDPGPDPDPAPDPAPVVGQPLDLSEIKTAEELPEAEFDAPALPEDVAAEALEVPDLTRGQIDWLKPRLKALPPNPYANTDFTAYTLDWGEVKVGLSNLQIGVLPRTQVGTNIPLDLIGLYNINAKVDPLRIGPVDLAFQGSRFMLMQDNFDARYQSVGGTLSVVAHPKLGLHAGAEYWAIGVEGIPDLVEIHPALRVTDEDLDKYVDPIALQSDAVSAHAAIDVRLNRRDSLILQGKSVVWKRTNSEESSVPPLLAGVSDIAAAEDGWQPVTQTYSLSGAYQMDFKRLSVRLGIGISKPRLAWALSTAEVSYRFGGKTKRDERVQRRTWRKNRRSAKDSPDAPDETAPEPSESE